MPGQKKLENITIEFDGEQGRKYGVIYRRNIFFSYWTGGGAGEKIDPKWARICFTGPTDKYDKKYFGDSAYYSQFGAAS